MIDLGIPHPKSISFELCGLVPLKDLTPGQALVDGPEGIKSRAVTAEDNLQAATGLNKSSRQVHQLLYDGLNPTPLGRMAYGGSIADQAQLPYEAQDVVCQARQGQNQGIGGELARGEALDVHIGLDRKSVV